MTSILRFLQIFSLGTWVGSIIYMSFVVAPGAFSILSNPDSAGALVGYSLTRLHWIGIIGGAVFLLATLALEKSIAALVRPAALLVILMLVLTAASQFGVRPRIDSLRMQMGSVAATPAGNPLRASFDRLHQYSVWLESAVLLSGLAAVFLTARQRTS